MSDDVIEIPNVTIVVEVLSPSTGSVDRGNKLADYFRVPSICHYILVNPHKLPIIHHARQNDGTILTRIVSAGAITFDPPGITVNVNQLLE